MRHAALLLLVLLAGCRFDMPTFCGDGVLDPGELCEDGNAIDGDGCDSDCTFTACGNGILTAGEQCDAGVENSDTAICHLARCGDSLPWNGREECDDGNAVTEVCPYGQMSCVVCDSTCHIEAGATAVCGDGIVQVPYERCDDNNNQNCGTCTATCQGFLGGGSGAGCPPNVGCNINADCASLSCMNNICQ